MNNVSKFKTTKVFDIPVAEVDLNGLFNLVSKAINREVNKPYFVTYANAHTMNLVWENERYKYNVQAYDLIYSDGVGVTIASKLLGGGNLGKMTGADWIMPFAELCAQNGWRVYLLGGKPGVAELTARSLTKEFPLIRIAGVSDGYFSDKSGSLVAGAIEIAKPDVVFVGMGSPKQEQWAIKNLRESPVKVVWCVGALFDYFAGEERRAPVWMLNWGLEWLWRLLIDPMGKWRRYVIGNPLFIFRVLQYRLRNK